MSKNILAEIAPTLATALLGPFGSVAAKFITSKLGHEDTPAGTKLDDFLGKFLDKPENLQKVQEIEQQFKLEMEKLNVDIFSLEVEDRKSARTLAEKDNRPQIMISVAFVLAYFVLLGVMFWAEISPEFNPGMYKIIHADKTVEWRVQGESLIDLFQVLMGVLTAGVGQILNFWFGGRMGRQADAS